MSILLAIPILSIAAILQSAVFSRITLLQGTADIILLTIIAWALQKKVKTGWQWGIIGGLLADFLSGLPFGIFTASYLLTIGIALGLKARIWRFIGLVQLFTTFIPTILSHGFSLLAIFFPATTLPLKNVLQSITLPSLMLNVFLTIPIFILIQELAWQLYPQEIEI